MEIAHRWIDRNLTRLELTVSLLILALFISFFSRYMFTVFGKVEKSMIDRTVININTAINYEVAFAIIKGDSNLINQLVLMNPMDIMTSELNANDVATQMSEFNSLMEITRITTTPSNYAGEVIDDSDPFLESGKWYFDKDDQFLFYKVNNNEFFTSEIDGPARIRFKIKLDYDDRNNDGFFNPSIDVFNSMQLLSIDQYEWSI